MVMLPSSGSTVYMYDKKPNASFFDTAMVHPGDVALHLSLDQIMSTPILTHTPFQNDFLSSSLTTSPTSIQPAGSPESQRRTRNRRPFKDLSRDMQCTEDGCERRYASKSSLSTHYRLKHSPEAKARERERLESIRLKSEERRTPRPVRPRSSSSAGLELMRHKSDVNQVSTREFPMYTRYSSQSTTPVAYRMAATPPPRLMNYWGQPSSTFYENTTQRNTGPLSCNSIPHFSNNGFSYSVAPTPLSVSMSASAPVSHIGSPTDIGQSYNDVLDLQNKMCREVTSLEQHIDMQHTLDDLLGMGLSTIDEQIALTINPSTAA
eukprot:CFRG6841T1